MGMKVPEGESLLAREVRAGLPLWRQVLLYLHPFAFFKDASSGPASVRERALSYNRAMRWLLVAYLRRWLLIAGTLFVGIAPAEALAAEAALVLVPAAVAVGFCIAVTVAFSIAVAYFLLGTSRGGSS